MKAIAALLGVLKSGKFYTPMDPSHHRARAASLLEDSGARLVITDTTNLPVATELAREDVEMLNVDILGGFHPYPNPGLPIDGGDLASILYTSGSTGRPKGVVHSHRSLLHTVMVTTNTLHVCSADRLTLLYSYTSIGGTRDILVGLLNGATIEPFRVAEEGIERLARWLVREEITIYRSVATIFRHLVAELTEERFPSIRLVHLGSEPIHASDLESFKRVFSPTCVFVASMGATEISPVRQFFADKSTELSGPKVPPGYPVEDSEVLILDADARELDFNQIGEISVRSRYLSLGYWRNLELTSAVFLPGSDGESGRIYRMGDLGELLADGCLLHHGRKDFQVKIRGHRIEVAEIEQDLATLENVKEAVVVARSGYKNEQELVAYLIPESRPAPTAKELRASLADRLPAYMIPSSFVVLDALPVTPIGKVDRRALPPPGTARLRLDTGMVMPRSPIEETISTIWAEVLDLDEVGVDDNFLELGGHSLLASQIVARVTRSFKLELDLRALFETSTIADMASLVTEHLVSQMDPASLGHLLDELETP